MADTLALKENALEITRRNPLSITAAGLIHIAGDQATIGVEPATSSDLTNRQTVDFTVERNRHAWLQVTRGTLTVNGTRLGSGDAIATSRPTELHVEATEDTDALLFDLA